MEQVRLCPFCLESVEAYEKDGINNVSCPRCGKYRITEEAYADLPDLNERQGANISGWLLENQDYLIHTKNFNTLLAIKTPGFFERVDRLMLALEKRTDRIGQYVVPDKSWLTATWCVDENELNEILEYLFRNSLLGREMAGNGHAYKIAPIGWKHIDELLKINADSQQGFVAMWFDNEMQKVYDEAISPGILRAGYHPHRVDLREHNDKIDDEIIAQIRRSRFVLADFTGQRGGVYFEAGFGKGLGLEVFWTCRKDEIPQLHFDIRQYNCIDWEPANLLEFRRRISNRIESVLGKGRYSQ